MDETMDETFEALCGLVGLIQLLSARDDMPREIRAAISRNHRMVEALRILERPAADPQLAQFAAIAKTVMRGAEFICTAKSSTMARRIARALNEHKPNSRGV